MGGFFALAFLLAFVFRNLFSRVQVFFWGIIIYECVEFKKFAIAVTVKSGL